MPPDLERAELQKEFNSLSAQIEATKRDLAREVNDETRMVLQTNHDDLYDRRRRIVERILSLPASQDSKGGRIVEYDELTRMIYEIKTDVGIMKRQFEDHLARCGTDNAGFPPVFLTFLAVGGVAMLLLLAFIVVRIGLPG